MLDGEHDREISSKREGDDSDNDADLLPMPLPKVFSYRLLGNPVAWHDG